MIGQLFITQLLALEDDSIVSFKKMLASEKIEEVNDVLIFQQPMVTDVFNNVSQSLYSPYTISNNFLLENEAEVLAMTIDGDFICGNEQYTYCIPKNLLKSDMEKFNLPIRSFFLALESGEEQSQILPDHLF
ncbi:hypothetical protein ACWN8V_11045 [Vagococcus elongatus]|uniref:Uncharacterized protein n=1 Tax=Vagococcus elongatus TaxID=180344 RepID=A0A430ANM6_9ENTE|nr:hypothetical protein [Vagococcus elongatus]RSU09699.1 hypothetical protein CBF29_11015 [Vagococcus elongatus]